MQKQAIPRAELFAAGIYLYPTYIYVSIVSVAYATIDLMLIQCDNLLQTGEEVWPQGGAH